MAITRPARPQSIDEFVQAAPDAARKGVKKGRKEQITVTIAPELLAKVDAFAAKRGQSRAAVINRAIFDLVESKG